MFQKNVVTGVAVVAGVVTGVAVVGFYWRCGCCFEKNVVGGGFVVVVVVVLVVRVVDAEVGVRLDCCLFLLYFSLLSVSHLFLCLFLLFFSFF